MDSLTRWLLKWGIASVVVLGLTASATAENWPAWRGPRGDGTSNEQNLPVHWDGEAGTNVVWKVPVPGRGHASPAVWGDRIFVSTCREERTERILLCLDRDTGKTLWQRVVLDGPLEAKRDFNSYASGTPATDGQQVYVSFLEPDGTKRPFEDSDKFSTPGHVIVAAYDMNGERKWKAKAGRFVGVNGYSCSPVLFKDKVVINADHDGTGYLVALNRNSGEISWKADRDNEVSLGSFVTPLIREIGDRTQMVLSGNGCVASLDPNDGSRHWFIDGPTVQFVASPVYDGNLLFLSGGHPKKEFLAIRPDGHGNVTESHIAWRTGKGCPMTPSPIVVSDRVIMVNDDGIASCLDADTGERQWMERLGTKHFASPVSAGGLVYLVGVDGVTRVIRPGPTYELVAENRVGDVGQECYASPAVSDGRIFLRVPGYLFCIFSR